MIDFHYPFKDENEYTDEQLKKIPSKYYPIIFTKSKINRRISWVNFQIIEILQELWNDSKYLLQRNKPPKSSPPISPQEIGSGRIHVYIDPKDGLQIEIIFSDFLPDHIKPYMDNPTIKMLRDLAYHSWLKRSEDKKKLIGYDKHIPQKMRMFDFEIDW